MSKEKPSNLTASIRQRLLNFAHERKEEFQLVLVRYAAERLLYRLSKSPHADQFLLKGALLFQLWTGQPHRATLDLDLLGQGDDQAARFENIFREVCATAVEDDGLVFLPDEVHGEEIREDQRYAGVRIHGLAKLGTAKIPLQIDIGFGDAVTPKPQKVQYARHAATSAVLSYWRGGKGDRGVDIVEESRGGVRPYEVKYTQGAVQARDLKGMTMFCEERGVAKGWVMTREMSDFGPMPWPQALSAKRRPVVMRVPAPLACFWLSLPTAR